MTIYTDQLTAGILAEIEIARNAALLPFYTDFIDIWLFSSKSLHVSDRINERLFSIGSAISPRRTVHLPIPTIARPQVRREATARHQAASYTLTAASITQGTTLGNRPYPLYVDRQWWAETRPTAHTFLANIHAIAPRAGYALAATSVTTIHATTAKMTFTDFLHASTILSGWDLNVGDRAVNAFHPMAHVPDTEATSRQYQSPVAIPVLVPCWSIIRPGSEIRTTVAENTSAMAGVVVLSQYRRTGPIFHAMVGSAEVVYQFAATSRGLWDYVNEFHFAPSVPNIRHSLLMARMNARHQHSCPAMDSTDLFAERQRYGLITGGLPSITIMRRNQMAMALTARQQARLALYRMGPVPTLRFGRNYGIVNASKGVFQYGRKVG